MYCATVFFDSIPELGSAQGHNSYKKMRDLVERIGIKVTFPRWNLLI